MRAEELDEPMPETTGGPEPEVIVPPRPMSYHDVVRYLAEKVPGGRAPSRSEMFGPSLEQNERGQRMLDESHEGNRGAA